MHLKAHLIKKFVLILEASLAFHCDSLGKVEHQCSLHVAVLATIPSYCSSRRGLSSYLFTLPEFATVV
jgi:hypothetical protein